MSDKRVIDLEAKQTLGSGDYLAADSTQGTYKVDANTNIMTPLANVRNNVANSSASPDKYSSSTAYKVGDMVIQNDILYKCTTACSAASWAVNSACFTATTLASVVTQLNSDLTWKTSGFIDGNNPYNLPSDWNEVIIEVKYGDSDIRGIFNIIKAAVLDSKGYRGGYYAASNIYGYYEIIFSNNSVHLQDIFRNGNNVMINSGITVFYR